MPGRGKRRGQKFKILIKTPHMDFRLKFRDDRHTVVEYLLHKPLNKPSEN